MSKPVTGPDGRTYTFPDDVTEEELVGFFEEQEQTTARHPLAAAPRVGAAHSDIIAVGPDGVQHIFPAGTPDEVVDRVMRQNIQGQQTQRSAVAAVARDNAERTGRRSLWERITDNAEDVWNTSAVVEGFRTGRAEGGQLLTGEIDDAEIRRRDGGVGGVLFGGPVNPARSLGRAIGSLEFGINKPGLEDAKADIVGERQRRQDLAVTNDAKQGGDSFLRYAREGDPGGLVAHGAAALLGTLGGAAADPVSYITGGRTLLTRALTQAGLAVGFDALAQDASVDAGIQQEFDYARSGMSAVAGAGFTLAGDLLTAAPRRIAEVFQRHPEADIRAELDTADDLMRPALSEADVPAIPTVAALPEGAEIVRRVEGGGALPGDVWNPELNAWMHRIDGPTSEAPKGGPEGTPDGPEAPSGAAVPARVQGGPEGSRGASEPPPSGDGQAGWDDVDWGKRASPERADATQFHLEQLRRWIKPGAVEDFVRRLDTVETTERGVYLNEKWIDWDAFKDNPQELLGLHTVVGDVFSDLYQAAGVKRQTWGDLRDTAKQFGFTLSDVLKTHADVTGEGGLARKMFAMRDVLNASVDDAASQMRTMLADIRAGRMNAESIHNLTDLIQRTAILGAADVSVSGEVARALNARKTLVPAKSMVNGLQAALDALNDAVKADGGVKSPEDVEKVLIDLLDGYDRKGATGFNAKLRKMRSMGFMDYVGYAAVANLLSGIPTHFKNLVGTPTHAVLDLSARFVAATVVAPTRRALLGSAAANTRSVSVRETVAYVEGIYSGLEDALRLGFEAFKKGAPIADNVSGVMTDTSFVPFAFSQARLEKWQRQGFTVPTAADIIGVAYFELARTLGFRPSVAADELNKALTRRAQLHALAYREAAYEAAKHGPGDEADKAFGATLRAIREEPTAEAFAAAKATFGFGSPDRQATYSLDSPEFEMQNILRSIDTRQAAAEHAQLMAYQRTGRVVESLEQFLRRVPIVKHFAANFVRTPTQLFVAAFRDFNPVTAPVVLALEATSPVGRARHKAFFDALRGEEEAMAGGGPAAEMVIARQVVGAAVLGVLWGYWSSGNIVGADIPEGDEYAGVLPYSVKVGNTWVQYTGYSPLAEHLGLVADIGQIFRTKELTDDQEFSLVGALGGAIRGNVFNKSFLKGLSDFMDLLEGGAFPSSDPSTTAKGMSDAAQSLVLGRAIPVASFLKRLAQSGDPVVRDARGWVEEATAYLPGLSETLTAKRDFMGRPMIRKPGEVGVLQVAKTSKATTDALERELANLANNPRVNLRITATPTVLDGQRLTAAEHNRLIEIQGQLYRSRRTGRNMEEELRHLITTPDYRGADPAYRETLLKRVISDFREDGKKAAFNPQSPLFMRDLVQRTSPQRAARDARSRGLSAAEAIQRRGRSYGLTADDTEQLQEALDEVE